MQNQIDELVSLKKRQAGNAGSDWHAKVQGIFLLC